MSIFGQVWLWSLAAFLVGAVLAWLVLVLPLRRSVRHLESALAQAHADSARTPANAAGLAAAGAPGTAVFARRPEPEPEPSQATSYPGTLIAPSPLGRDDVHDDIDEDFAELDSQVPPRSRPEPEPYREEPREAEYRTAPEAGEDGLFRANATQVLTPVDASPAEQDDPYRTAATEYLVDEDEPAGYGEHAAHDGEGAPRHEEPETGGSLFQPPAADPDWFDREPATERSAFEEPVERTRLISTHPGSVRAAEARPETEDKPRHAFADDDDDDDDPATGGVLEVPEETPAEMTQVLPKRRPREGPLGAFDSPQPIQPSMRTVERREPDLPGGHSGSLFEPSVAPGHVVPAPEPPPARQTAVDLVPPGPFGPGSAMPRPGGGRPADGFEVKASVTALRYCTEESAQFPKMVAEVWFRTAEDAERVGFRPLS